MDAPILYDVDIREPLFEYLEDRFGKARIFEEKRIGHSQADTFMLMKERFASLEIKNDTDTYKRLKRQVRDYDWYFDHNFVVVGKPMKSMWRSISPLIGVYWWHRRSGLES